MSEFKRSMDKCLKPTRYQRKDAEGNVISSNKKVNMCVYYDLYNKNCTLNGCIRNFTKGQRA